MYVFIHQQVVKSIRFILCLLVLPSPLTVNAPEQKCTCYPDGAVVLSSWVGFVVICFPFLWKLLFIQVVWFYGPSYRLI